VNSTPARKQPIAMPAMGPAPRPAEGCAECVLAKDVAAAKGVGVVALFWGAGIGLLAEVVLRGL
jgi:hypothetical protein